jgi:hypothetical protein
MAERERERERPIVCNVSGPVHCVDGGAGGDDCFIIVIVLFTLTS